MPEKWEKGTDPDKQNSQPERLAVLLRERVMGIEPT